MYSIKLLNTFSIDVQVKKVIIVKNQLSLYYFWKKSHDKGFSVLILGEGSNVLFLENYVGVVLLNRIKGISIVEGKTYWRLHIGAGEKWHDLVMYTIKRNISGLENLAYIPGYVGAAPVNNIGAYGLELSQICEYVDVLELYQGCRIRFSQDDCCFRYRDSIFKSQLHRYAIIFVGLKLRKLWRPILYYPELRHLHMKLITPRQIMNFIILIRKSKLPNPKIHGNAGSFFKNPIVDIYKAYSLLKVYPNIPYYFQQDGTVKLLAGWLIDRCQLRGYVLGEVSVYSKQSLVLINNRQKATGTEVAALAFYIYNKVLNTFNIRLQPEVKFIGYKGEINPIFLFKKYIF